MRTITRTLPGRTPSFSGVRVVLRLQIELIELGMRASPRFLVDFSDAMKMAKKISVKLTPEIVATCLVTRLIDAQRDQRHRDQAEAQAEFPRAQS